MHGLYVLWWVQEKHVSVAAVAAVLAAGDVALTLLEIPTGWLADRFSYRASLIAGSMLQVAGMLFAWLGDGVTGVLASSLVIAAGDAFRSGADQALLYRSCVAVGDAGVQGRKAQARGLQLAVLVGFVLAGGAIVETWGFATGWIVETAISAIGLAIACAMVEPPEGAMIEPPDGARGFSRAGAEGARVAFRSAEASRSSEHDASRSSEHDPSRSSEHDPSRSSEHEGARGFSRAFGSLVLLIAPAAVVQAAASAGTFFLQSAADRDPAAATLLIAIVTLAEAVGALVASRITAGMRMQVVLAGIGMGVAGAAFISARAFQPAIVALSFLTGLMFPLRAAAIQRVAADRVRARAASLASAIDKVLATVALLAAGFVPRGRRSNCRP